jgi:hypothetical protein
MIVRHRIFLAVMLLGLTGYLSTAFSLWQSSQCGPSMEC